MGVKNRGPRDQSSGVRLTLRGLLPRAVALPFSRVLGGIAGIPGLRSMITLNLSSATSNAAGTRT